MQASVFLAAVAENLVLIILLASVSVPPCQGFPGYRNYPPVKEDRRSGHKQVRDLPSRDQAGRPSSGYGRDFPEAWSSVIYNRLPSEGLPLFLTPYLEAGRISEARTKSRVSGISDDAEVESYAGYFTVNKSLGSHMFFWFFPAESRASGAPLLLWLNGGPGRSSMIGALTENGPYEITERATLKRRKNPWTRYFSMLYIDNPVGAGYSYTENAAGYSTNMDHVADNLYKVLTQFFQLFPSYRRNDFYAGGQSYAGKYIPALGRWIHDRNVQSGRTLINFKGIYLGAGFCDPVNMLAVYPDYLYHMGLVSNAYREKMKATIVRLTNATLYGNHPASIEEIVGESLLRASDDFGYKDLDNLLGSEATNTKLMVPLNIFLTSVLARGQLHVGYATTKNFLLWSTTAAVGFENEFLTSTSHHNAFLMDRYKVLHYSGNLDLIVSVPMTEVFLDKVKWSGLEEYRRSDRKRWYLDETLAGWYTKIGNFTRVIIRNSGHMAPYDQPEATLDMMRRFVFDRDFSAS